MSDNDDQTAEPEKRPPRRKLKKRPNRDDIFSYRGQIPLSFRGKKLKVDSDSSESEDNDEAFQRVQAEQHEAKELAETRESDSDGEDDLICIREDKSMEDIDSSTSDIREVSFNRSPSPPPPDPTAATRLIIHERQMRNPRIRELDNVLDNLKRSTDSTLFSPDSHRPSSVVNVDNLDDSFGLPSPSERTVVAKVRTRTGMRRFTMKASEPFGKIILQLAEQEGVTEDKILLTLKDINILGYDTPISVQLNVADIIECVVMNTPAMTDKIDDEEANQIEIKVQGKDADSKKTFKISKTDPLEKLMTAYCEFRKMPHSKLKFFFDGELLNGSETPVDLDMEEEDIIDVREK